MDDDHTKLDAALKTIASLAKVHPKLDAALNEIAILAEVPEACAWPPFVRFGAAARQEDRTKRDSFHSFMLVGLREGRQLHLREAEIIAAFPTWNAVDCHLENIALEAEDFANSLEPADEAHSHALEQLRLQLIASWSAEIMGELAVNNPLGRILAELAGDNPLGRMAEILGEFSITRSSLQKTKDDPATFGYQTTNIKKHLGARCVIRWLIISSDKMGKKLTFSRGPYDVEGPLLEAISILKEADKFFSFGFFPEKLRVICEDVRSELNRK